MKLKRLHNLNIIIENGKELDLEIAELIMLANDNNKWFEL